MQKRLSFALFITKNTDFTGNLLSYLYISAWILHQVPKKHALRPIPTHGICFHPWHDTAAAQPSLEDFHAGTLRFLKTRCHWRCTPESSAHEHGHAHQRRGAACSFRLSTPVNSRCRDGVIHLMSYRKRSVYGKTLSKLSHGTSPEVSAAVWIPAFEHFSRSSAVKSG